MRYATKWPEYAIQWDRMKINKSREDEFDRLAHKAMIYKDRYLAIQRRTGVLWYMIAALHRRESNADFRTYLGNGEPLNRVTRLVPRGRGPWSSFEDGAVDALKIDGLFSVRDWRLEKILYYCELFNGTGYNNRGLPSPYIWGGTNIQRRGKYVADGKFDPRAIDGQPGCGPLLYAIDKLDSTFEFTRET